MFYKKFYLTPEVKYTFLNKNKKFVIFVCDFVCDFWMKTFQD